jgi:hypothetical protein
MYMYLVSVNKPTAGHKTKPAAVLQRWFLVRAGSWKSGKFGTNSCLKLPGFRPAATLWGMDQGSIGHLWVGGEGGASSLSPLLIGIGRYLLAWFRRFGWWF